MRRIAMLAATALAVSLGLAGCEREKRRFNTPPSPASSAGPAQRSGLHPGPSASAASAAYQAAPPPPAPVAPASSASSATSAGSARTASLRPSAKNPHEENAFAVAQGKRYFRWYNCAGCHSNGGGGMGPPLMDDQWIYGSEPEQIVATILQGRPNGMPSFAGRIPEDQVWQIAAYVRSMSGQLRADVAPSRGDSLSAGPPEGRRDKETPKRVGEPKDH
jgi:cytochrome c oxidase cbb3-type subunit 3